jgi:hypothetical protein
MSYEESEFTKQLRSSGKGTTHYVKYHGTKRLYEKPIRRLSNYLLRIYDNGGLEKIDKIFTGTKDDLTLVYSYDINYIQYKK